MAAGRRNLHRALDVLLPADVGKVEVELALLLVKLAARVDDGRLKALHPIQKTHHVEQVVHAVDVKFVDHGRLTDVLPRHNQSLKLFFSRLNGNGQGAADGLKPSVKSQLAHEHILRKTVAFHLAQCGKDAYGYGQIIAAALLAQVCRSKVYGSIVHGQLDVIVLQRRNDTVAAFLNGSVGKTGKMEQASARHADLHRHGCHFQAVDRGAECLNQHGFVSLIKLSVLILFRSTLHCAPQCAPGR